MAELFLVVLNTKSLENKKNDEHKDKCSTN